MKAYFHKVIIPCLALVVFWDLSALAAQSEDLAAKIQSTAVFYEPLAPIGGEASEAENQELWRIILLITENPSASAIMKLEGFLKAYPDSVWAPSLRANLARHCERRGRYSLAVEHWQAAWDATKYSSDPEARRVADFSYAYLTRVLLGFGRVSELGTLLTEARERSFGGIVLRQIINTTRDQYLKSVTGTDASFRCGSLALAAVAQQMNAPIETVKGFAALRSPTTGFSLSRLRRLAEENRVDVAAVKAQGTYDIAVPSVVHWKGDHFAAIVERRGRSYRVADPGFGDPKWMTGEDIRAEASGYYLIPRKLAVAGFTEISEQDGANVFGRGYTEGIGDSTDGCANRSGGGSNSTGTGGGVGSGGRTRMTDVEALAFDSGPSPAAPCREGTGCSIGGGGTSTGGSGTGCCSSSEGASGGSNRDDLFIGQRGAFGMPVWEVSEPYINLWLYDQPLGYRAGGEQDIGFRLAYRQRDSDPVPASIFNLGELWHSSWMSYVTLGEESVSATMVVAEGGKREYNPDGQAVEFFSYTVMEQVEQSGVLQGLRVRYSDGSRDEYMHLRTLGLDKHAFLTKRLDRYGRAVQFIYNSPEAGVVKLLHVLDGDGRTNTVSYENPTFPAQITSVEDPFGRKAFLMYNTSGLLTNIVDVQGLTNSVQYDAQGWITDLTTVYGTTRFEHWTNFTSDHDEFGQDCCHSATHNNPSLPIRAIRVVDPEGQTNVYMLKQDCSFIWTDYRLFPDTGFAQAYLSTDPAYTLSMPSVPVWDLDPIMYMDSSYQQYRNSFHWGPKQAALLPSDITTYSVANFIQGRRRHWFHTADPSRPLRISQVLGLQQDPSPDGVTPGQVTWYGYRFLESSPPWQPSESRPALVAQRLSTCLDTWYAVGYTWYDRDKWGRPTNIVSTYSLEPSEYPLSALLRTNTYIYSADGIDLRFEIGPDGHTNRSYFYDGSHRLLRMTNASGGVHYYTYDSAGRLTSSKTPGDLITTNIYFPSGPYTNWISTISDNLGRTNSYTYTNNLVWTHTDERGLTVTNTWDALNRLRQVNYPDGTFVTNTYDKLDLVRTVDRMGNPSIFAYDALRRLTAKTNALGAYTLYQYCSCSGLESVEDAEGNHVWYYYDNAGRHTQTILPGPFVVSYHRNLIGQVTNVTDSAGLNITNWYNNQGLLYASSNAFGRVKQVWYDIEDRVTNSADANGIEVQTTYDASGRMASRSHAGGAIESFGYSERGLIAHTNQIGKTNFYAYDIAGRKTFETNANWEVTEFRYDSSGNLTNLIDAKKQNTWWNYDIYGRVTNKVDHLGTNLFVYSYDPNGRLTNRISAAKGQTLYRYDPVGNLTNIDYALSTNITFAYDRLNRLTNMVDAAGTTRYSYDAIGQLEKEDGPWAQDTVNYSYTHRLRSGMALDQPGASPWAVSFGYDAAKRLTAIASPAGEFGYDYRPEPETLSPGSLVHKLTLPTGGCITNEFDAMGRLLKTSLRDSQNAIVNSHGYIYNPANQRTQQVFTAGNYTRYDYDNIGQLKLAAGLEANGVTTRLHERFGYSYDTNGNLAFRTNYSALQTFKLNALNQITNLTRYIGLPMYVVAGTTTSPATNVSVWGTGLSAANAVRYDDNTWARAGANPADGTNIYTAVAQDAYGRTSSNSVSLYLPVSTSFQYDLNGNMLSDGRRGFDYDDENQLIRVTITNQTRSDFVYDGKMRRRERIECTWNGTTWVTNEIVHYVYDGNLVLQERHYTGPQVATSPQLITYTRGLDLSGSLQGAGGIGGLLARSDMANVRTPHAYYHADGNGNVTCLVNSKSAVVAKYIYDPYGNMIAASGPLADVNLYRFSSKEWHVPSGLVYYLYRYYEPNLQRWLNRDPVGKSKGQKLFYFVLNDPLNLVDPWGHMHATGTQRKDDGRASIVCDGKGGVRIYYPPGKEPKNPNSCEAKCLLEHENSHKWDALNENPDICKGQPDGTAIAFDGPEEQAQGEVRASQVELDCLDDCKNPRCDPNRRKQVEDYQKKYEEQMSK